MTRTASEARTGLYRSRRGIICGICRGIAEYLDFSVFWTRVIAVGLLVLSGFWPMAAIYVLAALVMKPKPAVPIQNEAEEEFYNSYVSSQRMALHRVQRIFDKLDHRIQRLEGIVTKRDYDWERRFHE